MIMDILRILEDQTKVLYNIQILLQTEKTILYKLKYKEVK